MGVGRSLLAGLLVACLFCVAAVVLPASVARADDRFAVYNIKVLDRITEIIPCDLNGDGLKDLAVLHTKGFPPLEQRWVSVFWQKSGGAFSSAADFTWNLPQSVVALDAGDVHEDPGEELLVLTPLGVSRLSYPDSASAPGLVAVVDTVAGTLPPSQERAPWIDFAQDWDGDGYDDVAVISLGKLLIFKGGGELPLTERQIIDMDVRFALSVPEDAGGGGFKAVSSTMHHPHFLAADVDGDGEKDLVSHWNDQIRFHLQRDGKFSPQADARVWLEVLTEDEKARRDFDLGITVADIDGDGTADVFAGKSTRQGVADFFSEVDLYFGDGTLDFDREPDWTASVQGMSWGRWLDLDGDGVKELMLPIVNLGITDLVRILLTKNVKIEFYFYFLGDNRVISDEPDFTKEVKLEVGFDEGGDAQIVNFEGDYDGDGRNDLVLATGKAELSVFLGIEPDKGHLFDKKPREKIDVETFGEFKPLDLNGDGREDMILYYSGHPEMSARARIIMNVGEW
jgi:hypothetical protein